MPEDRLDLRIESHLDTLCFRLGNRHVGSAGNRRATAYFQAVVSDLGFATESESFDCIEWEAGDVLLEVAGRTWSAQANPYSLPCDASAELVGGSTFEELEKADIRGRIVLLHGELAAEQITPKGFVFYNPDSHRRLIALLEAQQPAALICATGKSPGTSGSLYPFPLFEDGDFDIPSVAIKDVDGEQLRRHVGAVARLAFSSRRLSTTAYQVVARKGVTADSRIVLCAHIDAKKGTPGALDNASGVATVMAAAELLKDYDEATTVEIVPFNGEDYYSAPGQMWYSAEFGERASEVRLAINLDGVGHRGAGIAYSFYNASDGMRNLAYSVFERDPLLSEGEPWPQGDHSLFAAAGCQAVALTSSNSEWLCREIIHTMRDRPDLVDCRKLARTAIALRDLVLAIARGAPQA